MRFSVIIPALNEATCIVRAAQSAWRAGASEVIVADGGSSDRTVALARAEGCRVVQSPPGRARQQNAAAGLATGDVLVFLHADGALGEEVGRQLAATFSRPSTIACAFRQRIDANGWGYRWLEWGNAQRVRWLGLPYGDQAISIRRNSFAELGGFPDVPLLEDLLLMRALRRLRTWPLLLPGPVHVSPRRWERQGILRQTLRNWGILVRFAAGASPASLAALYRRHDQP